MTALYWGTRHLTSTVQTFVSHKTRSLAHSRTESQWFSVTTAVFPHALLVTPPSYAPVTRLSTRA